MRTALLCLLVAGTALGQGYAPGGGGVSSTQVLSTVQDAGTLAGFNVDVPGNTFIAANRAPDGGSGTYSFISMTDSKIKLGPGSAAEIGVVGNDMTVNAGSLALPTTNIAQPACVGSNTCRWYSAAWGPGWVPTGSLPSCAAGQEGGMVALTTDHYPYFCDGTAARRVALEVTSALQLPTSTTAGLPSASPAGRILYDTDAACVKFSNGSTWSCI